MSLSTCLVLSWFYFPTFIVCYMLVSKFCKYDLIVKNKFWFMLSYTVSFCLCCFTSLAFSATSASADIIFFNFLELHSVFLKKDFHYIFPLMDSHSPLTASPPHTHTHTPHKHTHMHTHLKSPNLLTTVWWKLSFNTPFTFTTLYVL